jgi:hypothetical protein
MGPFVPDLISDQLNLIVALLLGIGFGFVLEQAGFSSSRRLAGVFYGYDFTVLRVFFTAAVTAMSGVLLLGYFGLLDTDAIYVNPTWLLPAIVGGAIMGVGFIVGGYCPGTSICAMAIGKVDALFFVVGGIVGVFGFGELFSLYKNFYDSTALGPLKVYDSLGISQRLFAFLLIIVAVSAFAVTTMIEKRVDKISAPSIWFRTRSHLASGAGVFALGILFIFLPDRKTHFINEVSDSAYISSHTVKVMSVDELAFRIIDKEPNLQIVDIRSPETFAKFALPGSSNIQMKEFFNKEWNAQSSRRHLKKVIVAEDDSSEHLACLLLQKLGHENSAMLEGGLDKFNRTILNASPFIFTGSRWDTDVMQFREKARGDILRMIEEGKNTAPKGTKKGKKIQGGC